MTVAVFLAAALTATPVGITARVLSDLGHLKSDESQVILGAAVIDDILGLVPLTMVSAVAAGEKLTVVGVAKILRLRGGGDPHRLRARDAADRHQTSSTRSTML